ncbi:MAG: hypothetical protein IPN63_08225 [Gammaproteobacteria bacterium]|nr:hypothetical protein [Gammaproteobacteria bacterium]
MAKHYLQQHRRTLLPGWARGPKGMNNRQPDYALPDGTLRNLVNIDVDNSGIYADAMAAHASSRGAGCRGGLLLLESARFSYPRRNCANWTLTIPAHHCSAGSASDKPYLHVLQ